MILFSCTILSVRLEILLIFHKLFTNRRKKRVHYNQLILINAESSDNCHCLLSSRSESNFRTETVENVKITRGFLCIINKIEEILMKKHSPACCRCRFRLLIEASPFFLFCLVTMSALEPRN